MKEFPEINLARRFVNRHKLVPPVDIFSVARLYSRVLEDDIPYGIDGLCLNIKDPDKRVIIINSQIGSLKRRRFTLAHELGHVLLPWHIGSIADIVRSTPEEVLESQRMEAEANRFASEVLMPQEWVLKKVSINSAPPEAINLISDEAQVSELAALFRWRGVARRGFVFAYIEAGVVKHSGATKGTIAVVPRVGRPLAAEMDNWGDERWRLVKGSAEYRWWSFDKHKALPGEFSETDWRVVLDEIILSLDIDEIHARKLKASISGITASVNSKVRENRSAEVVYAQCLERFVGGRKQDAGLQKFCDHPNFVEFLARRVRAFFG